MKKNLFELVRVSDYHESLMSTWLRLSKDGLVKKDDVEGFSYLGAFYTDFVMKNEVLPGYDKVLDWVVATNS